jgi:hypothetical protein
MTHAELGRLYAMGWVGTYLPEAVLVETVKDGRLVPAMTYIKPEMEDQPPAEDYVDRIVNPGKQFGFPAWYLDRIDRFRPSRRGRD